jgi:hypothetical protein
MLANAEAQKNQGGGDLGKQWVEQNCCPGVGGKGTVDEPMVLISKVFVLYFEGDSLRNWYSLSNVLPILILHSIYTKALTSERVCQFSCRKSGLPCTCNLSDTPPHMTQKDTCRKKTDVVVDETQTGWEDRGTGATHYLDRLDVDCNGAPITGFTLKSKFTPKWPENGKLAYEFTCLEGAGLDVAENKTTTLEDDDGGNLIFLDRLNVNCGDDAAISRFHLVRDGGCAYVRPSMCNHNKEKYEYTCVSRSKTKDQQQGTALGQCSTQTTAPEEGGEGGKKVEFLDRHRVQCPEQQILTKFRLRTTDAGTKEGKVFYEFTCCAVAGLVPTSTPALPASTYAPV